MNEFSVLTEVGTPFKAQLIAGVLKSAGILVVTDAEGPVDEFTVSQRAMGQGIRVFVPTADLEAAQSVLQELRDNPPDPDSIPWDAGGSAEDA